jgi:small subunit ribosomal protein S21
MIIINIKDGNIEKALKEYKRKVLKTKQTQELQNRKEFVKSSVKSRTQKLKAIYKQSKNTEI